MKTGYSTASLAAGLIKRGILRLADKYPFHAQVLEKLRLSPSALVGSMGVSALADGVRLAFDPEFVLSVPAGQLGGMLLHEVHHVVFEHLFIRREDYPDVWALIVATEVSVNEFVREPLPPGAITLDMFPALPPMESWSERYQRLRKVKKEDRLPLSAPLDNHDVWGKVDSTQEARRVLVDLLQEAAMEAGGVPRKLAEAVAQQIIDRLPGDSPGDELQVLQGDQPGGMDWRSLLRRYVGQVLEPRPLYHHPPRRFPQLVGILPGRRRHSGRARVVAVVDTSGSVAATELELMAGELSRISRSHPVTVVECDCQVQRVYPFRGKLAAVQGRGGTDFRPPLERQFLRKLRADVVVYLTDGHGEAPEQPPSVPVIWCLTKDGEIPATWGRVVRMG